MKKSSLITLALASLVGLVGCNQQAASLTVAQKTSEAYIEAFFLENYYHDDEGYITNKNGFRVKDENGNYIKIDAKRGEVAEDTFRNAILLNPEVSEEMTYYQIPDMKDSYATMFTYYDGITEEDLAGVGEDGNTIVDIVLNNTLVSGVNLLFGEDGTNPQAVFGFEDFAYISDQAIELLDNDEDGVNDLGYSEWVNYGSADTFNPDTDIVVVLEMVSYIYQFEGDTTYTSILQVNIYNYSDMIAE